MTASQRPRVLTIIAWLSIVSGALRLLIVFSGDLSGLMGLLELIFGLGALALKPWAWRYGIIVQIFDIFINLVSMFISGFFFTSLITIFLSGLFLYYLFTPAVKRVFGKA